MLSERVNPSVTLGLGYYPLPKAGERFPVCDPAMEPVLHPRPDNDAEFLQGMFEVSV